MAGTDPVYAALRGTSSPETESPSQSSTSSTRSSTRASTRGEGPPLATARPIGFPHPDPSPSASAELPAPSPSASAESPAPPPGDAPQPEQEPWHKGLAWNAFVDAYAGLNSNTPARRQGSNSLRAFDPYSGFAFAWAGINLAYEGKQWGSNLELRFGPSADIYNNNDAKVGLGYVKQAYASYKPKFLRGVWSFDLGKFDTPYGAEVADSQFNFNYTRGALNWLGQPFFHTGFRAHAALHPQFDITGIAVNGWNHSIDNNRAKSFGLQFHLQALEHFDVYLGYLTGPESNQRTEIQCEEGFTFVPIRGCIRLRDSNPEAGANKGTVSTRGVNRRWRHFVDLVLRLQPTQKLELLANGDVGYDEVVIDPIAGNYVPIMWYGAMLSARYRFLDSFWTSLRGEWYEDPDGATSGATDAQGKATDLRLFTATLTFEYRPVPNLIFKLDGRHDLASREIFDYRTRGVRPRQSTLTLGAVVSMK